MRFAHLETDKGRQLAVSVGDGFSPLDALVSDGPATFDELLAEQDTWMGKIAAAATGATPEIAQPSFDVPFAYPRPLIAIGLNYHDHCREFGTPPPEYPIVFAKLSPSVVGPNASISWSPRVTSEVDWEAELGVVIGREARSVSPGEAEDYIFGYTAVNDVTARDIQRSEQQWVRAKSLDTFAPIGPVVVTRDEVDLARGLRIRSWVNGALMQDSSTSEMIFDVHHLVAYLSSSFTLMPGDVIATGTPLGVGAFRTPPIFLKDGDVVEVEIEGVGRLRNQCHVSQ